MRDRREFPSWDRAFRIKMPDDDRQIPDASKVPERQPIQVSLDWVIFIGVVCLGADALLGRSTVSVSPPSATAMKSETYATCMIVYRDVAGCAEVMKNLTRPEAN
jgi:hypothetical protein